MLIAALMFGVVDLWQSTVPSYGAQAITLGHLWDLVSARSMDFVEGLIIHHLWSPIWNVGITPILVAPAWTFFGVLGLAFFLFGQPKAENR